MKKHILLVLLPILILLSGCATPPSAQQLANIDFGATPVDYESTIKKYFEDSLFDPDSARYDFQSPEQMWVKDSPLMGGRLAAGYMVRVGVNAKNRLGGYTGKQMYGFIIKDERIIKVMDQLQLQNLKTK